MVLIQRSYPLCASEGVSSHLCQLYCALRSEWSRKPFPRVTLSTLHHTVQGVLQAPGTYGSSGLRVTQRTEVSRSRRLNLQGQPDTLPCYFRPQRTQATAGTSGQLAAELRGQHTLSFPAVLASLYCQFDALQCHLGGRDHCGGLVSGWPEAASVEGYLKQ